MDPLIGAPSMEQSSATSLLARITVNHLFLGQYEAFRASLKILSCENPRLSFAILEAILENVGNIHGTLWSKSMSSPAHLAWLALGEITELQTSMLDEIQRNIDYSRLKHKLEALFLLQQIIQSVETNTRSEFQTKSDEESYDDSGVSTSDPRNGAEGLKKIYDAWYTQLKSDISQMATTLDSDLQENTSNIDHSERTLSPADEISYLFSGKADILQRLFVLRPELFQAICWNLVKQKRIETKKSKSILKNETNQSNDPQSKVFPDFASMLQEGLQRALLGLVKKKLDNLNSLDCFKYLRHLQSDFAVPESEYRGIVHAIGRVIYNLEHGLIKSDKFRMEILELYEDIQCSGSVSLITSVESVQDSLLHEAVESYKASDKSSISPPLHDLHQYLRCSRGEDSNMTQDCRSSGSAVVQHSLRRLYHYARVTGGHMFEIVMDAAIAAIKSHHFQKAVDVLAVFPRLQSLVTVMGWDLLAGDTSARRQMMEFLWAYKPMEPSLYRKNGEELCCVDHLCNQLCYHLDLAYFAAHINTGQRDWGSSFLLYPYPGTSKTLNRIPDIKPADDFVANLVLERLTMHSPIRVLFDVVPDIKVNHARTLLKMHPVNSSATECMRLQDLEVLELHFGIRVMVLALAAMERSMISNSEIKLGSIALNMLEALRDHIHSIYNVPRKILLISIVIDLLHIDETFTEPFPNALEIKLNALLEERSEVVCQEYDRKITPVVFVGRLLEVLQQSLPSHVMELEDQNLRSSFPKGFTSRSALKVWEEKLYNIQEFIKDWEWRLAVLQRLSPLSQHQWQWKEALAVLCAAPSTLLNMCVQRAQYDLGEEAIHRFSLPPEDEVALQLAEWVNGAVARASVDDVVTQVAEGSSSPEEALKLVGLRAPLSPLASALLCIDVSVASAKAIKMSKQLLLKAKSFLTEVPLRQGSSQNEPIQDTCMVSVSKRVLHCLQDLLEKVCMDKQQTLQSLLCGADMISSTVDGAKQGHRYRALNILQQTIEDAHSGKRMFLSGKLHNLVKALADEETDDSGLRSLPSHSDRKSLSSGDNGLLIGCGIRGSSKHSLNVSTLGSRDHVGETMFFPLKGTGKRFLGPLSSKPFAYLSAFILYIATIGDIVDGVDTTHDFNFFQLVYQKSNDLLTRLVFERGSANAAGKVADIMGADLTHEVISACVPPIYPPKSSRGWARIPLLSSRFPYSSSTQSERTSSKISEQKAGLYPLDLDVVKHLATLSPVRAILACVFGTTMFRKYVHPIDMNKKGDAVGDMDSDRRFYEFALDQSDRFQTLNRWIQTQAKLHYLSDFPMLQRNGFFESSHKKPGLLKRPRKDESDFESEEDDEKHSIHSHLSTHKTLERYIEEATTFDHIQMERVTAKKDDWSSRCSASMFFEWENESIYEETVERLIDEGKLSDALAIADRYLCDGPPDYLLQLLIEQGDDTSAISGQWQGSWNNSWQYCLRLRDKRLAASLAIKNIKKWDLEAGLDVLTMCSCHISQHDLLHQEVRNLKNSLQLYGRILHADGKFTNWQEVENLCQRDPEELALRLAGKGAVSAALEVAESYKLREELCRELQGRKLVKLLMSDPVNGGGPAEALRFLGSLHAPEDALPIAMAAMEQLPSLQSRQLLVHFFLKRRIGVLSDTELSHLNKLAMGLRILGSLPLPWQQRCAALHQHPHLILETLLMWKELQVAAELLQTFPALRDDNLVLTYATKAITVGAYKKYEHRQSNSTRSNVVGKTTNGNYAQRVSKRWTTKDSSNKLGSKDVSKKRKANAHAKAAWDSATGIRDDDKSHASGQDSYERLAPLAMTEGLVLTGDHSKDDVLRDSHHYEGAPCFPLFKALITLFSSEELAVKLSVRIIIGQMKLILGSQQLNKDTPSEIMERAFYATEAFVQALLHAKAMLKKLLGSQELTAISEGSREGNCASSYENEEIKCSTSIDLDNSDSMSKLLVQVVEWLSKAEVLQSLLSSNVTASLDDVSNKESAEKLRDRLIDDERYNMAVYCCTKCKIDAFPVWRAWALALIQIERYPQARVKLRQALKLYKDDPAKIAREIVSAMEACPPVDIASVRSLYDHMAKNASTMQDDSLSADAYLNVLYMPSFTKSERSKRSTEDSVDSFAAFSAQGGEEGPRTNLDSYRYEECVFYLQEYARQDLLAFMFKHCRYADACLLFFPAKSVPAAPWTTNTSAQLSTSAPQKPDQLATDYGSIEDLCELCITYGAMPVLERVIATRELSSSQDSVVSQHTAAALGRICTYCENHKHFNHLYRFQVLKKDHVAAALCCIQLFLNSSNQEQALRHLERAKTHFDEGYNARQQVTESSKTSSKVIRGKSASDRFTEEELTKFSVRVSTQMQVVNSFSDADGLPWKYSLFGNPNDPDTIKRRSEVVEALAERNFDLAFRIIFDFQLPSVPIYAAVAANLAERKKFNQLTELFKNIKAFISEDDLDEVIGAAIMVFAKYKERPDRLIEMLSTNHRKVLSCVACGRLKTAFQIASRSGSIADVQYVSDMAKRSGLVSVVDMCKQWLLKQK